MYSTLRKTRTTIALSASAALLTGLGGLGLGAAPAWTDTSVTATTSVNIRSSPSTASAIVGGLYRGQAIATAGQSRAGWTPIRFHGKTAYISSRYLTTVSAAKPTGAAVKPTGVAAKTTRYTTAALNVRSGPATSYSVVGLVVRGGSVAATGATRSGFTEIIYAGKARWVSSDYLVSTAPGSPTTPGTPKVIGTRFATTALMIRSTSTSAFKNLGDVPTGTKLSITGIVQNGRAQIIYQGAVRWVTAQYLAASVSAPAAPSLPTITGSRYATADLLIRTTADEHYTVITTVPKGSILQITGIIQNGRMQVIYQGAARWVTAQYLSSSKPAGATSPSSGVEKGLTANARNLLNQARATFPEITTYYGVRPDPIPDHPSGRALDLMIPNYRSAAGQALGKRIIAWAQKNQPSLHIEYIIHNQHIWNVRRASEGWRFMADRGSDTANHKDHVHITVLS